MLAQLWSRRRELIIDIFVLSNLAFLAVDIYFAHSMNEFDRSAEWIPLLFSILAPPLLIIFLFVRARGYCQKSSMILIEIIAYLAIVIGIVGLILHLKSQFFSQMNLKSLVYTAPFMAPLAYSGLGFLLLLNRKVSSQSLEWGQWIVFFALGGFLGNFILSLCDHAQNGFYYSSEWIPVIASAFAVGFLVSILIVKPGISFLNITIVVIVIQIIVGLLGFYFHFKANTAGPTGSLFDDFVYGAPVFAPLLFADLAVLAIFGVYDLRIKFESKEG